MDEQQEKDIKAFRDLYLTEGWRTLRKELQVEWDTLDTVSDISTEAQLQFRRGQTYALYQIINHEASLDAFVASEEDKDTEGYSPEPEGY